MLTFSPGPSKLADHVPSLYQQGFAEGLASISHRSAQFEQLYANTVAQLHSKLTVPEDYSIFFLGSATEGWEVIAQSLIGRSALHLHSGAFGAKWFEYANKLHPETEGIAFGVNDDPAPLLERLRPEHEALCLTHNETSNATLLETSLLEEGRRLLGDDRLLCIDATSSMGGIALPWALGDVWYASCQKCFGQPAGLAVMVCSPRAMARAQALGENGHYNSLLSIAKFAQSNQTPFTANVMAIGVLGRHLALTAPVTTFEPGLRARADAYYGFIEQHPLLSPLVERVASQSPTVVAVKANPEAMGRLKAAALEAGIQLGSGYGIWKEATFRIANFPAYTDEDQRSLIAALDAVR